MFLQATSHRDTGATHTHTHTQMVKHKLLNHLRGDSVCDQEERDCYEERNKGRRCLCVIDPCIASLHWFPVVWSLILPVIIAYKVMLNSSSIFSSSLMSLKFPMNTQRMYEFHLGQQAIDIYGKVTEKSHRKFPLRGTSSEHVKVPVAAGPNSSKAYGKWVFTTISCDETWSNWTWMVCAWA